MDSRLAKRKVQQNLRTLQLKPNLIDFASNDYLGLARSGKLSCAWNDKMGATGSRLLTGNSEYAEELEQQIAQFHGAESGLLFNCGYMANLGVISALAESEDTILYDILIHASTHDGIRLSKANAFPFRHNDLDHLETRLKAHQGGKCFICIESIYSTNGAKAPLKEIHQLAQHYHADLIVDEAHAVGVCGVQGKGLVAESGLTKHVLATVATFGKALGTFGAIVLGSRKLKKTLINFASPFIYTTALPFYCLAAIKSSYDLFPFMDAERLQLKRLKGSLTHIQSIKIPGNKAVNDLAKKLALNGFDVRPLMSPTVQRGSECLRICLHAYNTLYELEKMKELINENSD